MVLGNQTSALWGAGVARSRSSPTLYVWIPYAVWIRPFVAVTPVCAPGPVEARVHGPGDEVEDRAARRRRACSAPARRGAGPGDLSPIQCYISTESSFKANTTCVLYATLQGQLSCQIVNSIHVTTHAIAERHSHAALLFELSSRRDLKSNGLGAVLVARFVGGCPQLRRLKRVLRNDRWGRRQGVERLRARRPPRRHPPHPDSTRMPATPPRSR